MGLLLSIAHHSVLDCKGTVEPHYNEDLETMKITLLYQSEKNRNIKSWDQKDYFVVRGFCNIRPLLTRFHCISFPCLYYLCTTNCIILIPHNFLFSKSCKCSHFSWNCRLASLQHHVESPRLKWPLTLTLMASSTCPQGTRAQERSNRVSWIWTTNILSLHKIITIYSRRKANIFVKPFQLNHKTEDLLWIDLVFCVLLLFIVFKLWM